MAEIVNLNRARKARERAEAGAKARRDALLDGARLPPPGERGSPEEP